MSQALVAEKRADDASEPNEQQELAERPLPKSRDIDALFGCAGDAMGAEAADRLLAIDEEAPGVL